MLFNADFARACIEPTKVFSIEDILKLTRGRISLMV